MEKDILKEIGLTDKEATIYIELLKEKICTASKLSKLTKINRTTVYLELTNLIHKGLVSYVIKDSKRYFQPASPDKLIEILDTKKEKVKSILPTLNALRKSSEPFHVDIFEGKEGIKTFYQDILNQAKEVLAFGVTGKGFEVLQYETPHFMKKFAKANITARYLANKSSERILKSLPKQVKVRYLPDKYFSNITTIIYGDKIAIQSLLENNIFVILIEDKQLYLGYKNYFEFMWTLTK